MMTSEELRSAAQLPGDADEEDVAPAASLTPETTGRKTETEKKPSLAAYEGDTALKKYDISRDVRMKPALSRSSSTQQSGRYDRSSSARAAPPASAAFDDEPDDDDPVVPPFSETYSTSLSYLFGTLQSQKFRESLILIAVLSIFGSIVAACIRGPPPELYVFQGADEATLSVFADADQVQKFERMRAAITAAGISTAQSLQPSGGNGRNARYAALAWLAAGDELVMDSHDDGLFARYALAVLWFETNGPLKQPGSGGSSPADSGGTTQIAEHHDEERHEGYNSDGEGMRTADHQGEKKKSSPEIWIDDSGWLTGVGICQWRGVTCEGNTEPDGSGEDESEAPTLRRRTANGADEAADRGGPITSLSLPSNGMSGPLPPELFTALKSLRTLDLSGNDLTGKLPRAVIKASFGPNRNGGVLDTLALGNNNLEGNLPPGLGASGTLTRLDMHNNLLNGTVPASLGDPSSALVYVFLEENDLTGTLPPELFSAPSRLRELSLRDNDMSGPIPEVVISAQGDPASANSSSAEGDISTATVMPMETLRLDHNFFTGSLPSSFSLFHRLTELHLFRNELVGTLPHSWSDLDVLTNLYLDHNQLSGEIPVHWGGMVRLRELYLESNALTGPISPLVIGGMTDMEKFMAGDNQLGGSLPPAVGELFKLRWMGLADNDFSGTLPPEMGSLETLEVLRINGNRFLAGAVPDSVCSLTEENSAGVLRELVADCNVNCSCCTECV